MFKKPKSTFTPGELVLCLGDSMSKGFRTGWVYRTHRVSDEWLYVEEDSAGDFNGWGIDNFRPLTKEEKVLFLRHKLQTPCFFDNETTIIINNINRELNDNINSK